MRADWIPLFATPGGGAGFDLDVFREEDGEVVEAFLISKDTRDVFPVIAGVAVMPPSLTDHLRAYGNVYRRTPLRDPRMVRFIVGRAGEGFDRVPFELVIAHYRDLAADPPPGYATEPHPDDMDLARVLDALMPARDAQRGLDLGCGVGRTTFTLRAVVQHALGIDLSLSLVRRARNIAVTVEDFFLPGDTVDGKRGDEVRLDLGALPRERVDFVAASAAQVPLCNDGVDVVVLHGGDARGPWDAPGTVVAEARRVLAPGGACIWARDLAEVVGVPATASDGAYAGARIP